MTFCNDYHPSASGILPTEVLGSGHTWLSSSRPVRLRWLRQRWPFRRWLEAFLQWPPSSWSHLTAHGPRKKIAKRSCDSGKHHEDCYEKAATQTTLRKMESIPIKTQSVAHHLLRSNGKTLKKSKDREKCSNHWKDWTIKGQKGLEACASIQVCDKISTRFLPASYQRWDSKFATAWHTKQRCVFGSILFSNIEFEGYEQTTLTMAEHFVFVRKGRLVFRLPRTAPRCYTLLGTQY